MFYNIQQFNFFSCFCCKIKKKEQVNLSSLKQTTTGFTLYDKFFVVPIWEFVFVTLVKKKLQGVSSASDLKSVNSFKCFYKSLYIMLLLIIKNASTEN